MDTVSHGHPMMRMIPFARRARPLRSARPASKQEAILPMWDSAPRVTSDSNMLGRACQSGGIRRGYHLHEVHTLEYQLWAVAVKPLASNSNARQIRKHTQRREAGDW